jgi:glycine/D-amino acid oxidase-like deaminating enzyme
VKEYPYWWDTRSRKSGVESRESGAERPFAGVGTPESTVARKHDVVIVGAGYTGLSAARVLAQAGASVLVLERDDIGSGASSRNGGQALAGLKLEPAALVGRFGARRARELYEISLEALRRLEGIIAAEAIDCGYARCGHIQCASKPSHYEAFRAERDLLAQTFGHRVELIGRGDQRREVGTDVYHGLLLDERSGALNPARLVDGLAAAASRAGAAIVLKSPVQFVRRSGHRFEIATAVGRFESDDVLMATDAYTTDAAPHLRRRLVSIGSYIIVTQPLEPGQADAILPRRRMAFDSKYFLHYFRLTDDGRLLFGGRAEFSEPGQAATRRAAAILHRDLAHVFPQLGGVGIDYAWSGRVAFTRDQMPRAGRLEGQYYAGGYAGHGVAMAAYLGELVARRIAGEPFDHPLFDDRLPPIPLYRGTPWFLPMLGAYYRLRDRLS